MEFFEEADLADMLSDIGIDVTWGSVTRKGRYRRHTEALAESAGGGSAHEEVPSVLVELAYFRGVKEGDAITVNTADGSNWKVRAAYVETRSLLRIFLAVA